MEGGGAIGVDREREEDITHEGGLSCGVVWISVSLSISFFVWYDLSLLFCFLMMGCSVFTSYYIRLLTHLVHDLD